MNTKFSMIVFLLCIVLQSNGQQIQNLNATQLNISGTELIELTWQSLNENEWCFFVIERSINNYNNFVSYDTLYAYGVTTDTVNYLFTDFGPLQSGSVYYYRLAVIVDNPPFSYCDLFAFYSDTVSVNFTTSLKELSNNSFKVFPNPSNGIIALQSDVSINSIKIYNAIGKVVYKQSNQNFSQYTIDITDKPSGIYYISINAENSIYNYKLIKQ